MSNLRRKLRATSIILKGASDHIATKIALVGDFTLTQLVSSMAIFNETYIN